MKSPIHPGEQLDHYQIESIAYHNALASVFRGIDLRTNRSVAIKVPDPEIETDPISFERFQREREIVKSLDHPGILKLIADDDPDPGYFVTEWFDGETLRDALTKKTVSRKDAVQIALNIAATLTYIHGHGIVHRDLRPENILVSQSGEIKLVNFGTAAKIGSRRITFTNLAQVLGVSEYISPEELNGKRGDARSDIYALGAIFYEMLTGKTPFQGASPYDRLLRAPIPPRVIDPTIAPQLQEIVYRALEREPMNRYANAHDFELDLKHPERVGIAKSAELRNWRKHPASHWKRAGLFVAIAIIPVAIFCLLLYFARP